MIRRRSLRASLVRDTILLEKRSFFSRIYLCNKPIDLKDKYHLHHECFSKHFDVSRDIDFIEFQRMRIQQLGSLEAEKDSSRNAQYHGNYPKFSARLGPDIYILKFGKTNAYPLLAETEYISNKIATQLNMGEASPYALIEFQGRRCFVVKNFLSSNRTQNLLHAWDIWPKNEHNQRKPFHLSILLALLETQVSYSECERVAELFLFDYIIGNDDRHRGNIGIIESSGQKKRLAPFYDNVSALGLEEPGFLDPVMRWHPAIRIQLESGATAIQNFLGVLRELGYEDSISRFQNKLQAKYADVLATIKEGPLHANLKACLLDLVIRRSGEILQWT